MIKVSNKKNLSSIQVLRTLQVLLQGNFSMQEILDRLNKNTDGYLYNNPAVSKYIHTLRCCGINVPKINNKYVIASMPFGFNLSKEDIALIEKMQSIVKICMPSKHNKVFDAFIEKLNRYSNQNIVCIGKNNFHMCSELFEKAIKDKRKVRIWHKNDTKIDYIPLNIVENNGRSYFHVLFNNNEDKMIEMSRVFSVEVLNEKFIKNFNELVVVFELKDELALRYNLRENERLIKNYDGNGITVANHGESKEILFSRLLRYDNKCEIIHPKIYREEMKNIINSALANYN